jgi:hypothetical protein
VAAAYGPIAIRAAVCADNPNVLAEQPPFRSSKGASDHNI